MDKLYLSNPCKGFKRCAGRYCGNIGSHEVTIIFLNKTGWFCSACKEILNESGLIVSDNDESIGGGLV